MGVLKKGQIYIQNDYFDNAVVHPENYDLNELLDISVLSVNNRYKILNYILEKLLVESKIDDLLIFRNEIKSYDIYDEYKDYLLKSDNFQLTMSFVLYFETDLIEPLYKNLDNLSRLIVDEPSDKLALKLVNLLRLSNFKCSDSLVKYIKKNLNIIVHKYLKNEVSEDIINNILNSYNVTIDNNQKELSCSLELKYR